jgi:hypothetical protein
VMDPEIFGFDPKQLMRNLVAARAINWAHDPLTRGAYLRDAQDPRGASGAFKN